MLLYIIRHGDPDYTTDSLTPKGILQAEAVGKRLATSGIDRIFSSPMGRARQTAEPACRLLGLEYTVEEWTHEIGDERLTTYMSDKPVSVNLLQNSLYLENSGYDVPFSQSFATPALAASGMESACNYIWEHGKEFLERLGYKEENGVYRILKPSDEKVALFCHAAFAKAWLSMLLRIPPHVMCASFNYCHTGVTILNFANYPNGFTAPRCLCYSDLSHFYKEDLDLVYNNHTSI